MAPKVHKTTPSLLSGCAPSAPKPRSKALLPSAQSSSPPNERLKWEEQPCSCRKCPRCGVFAHVVPEKEREGEVGRRIRTAVDGLVWHLEEGALLGAPDARVKRCQALNILQAVRLALWRATSGDELKALDGRAHELLDELGQKVPAPGGYTHLSASANMASGEKRAYLRIIKAALDKSKVPLASQLDQELREEDIQKQIASSRTMATPTRVAQEQALLSSSDGATLGPAREIALAAMQPLFSFFLRDTARAPIIEVAYDLVVLAPVIRYLINMDIAGPKNVGFVTLYYFGVPWKKRKGFFTFVSPRK